MQRYRVFEVTGGFCAIAWNDRGITGFQLPTSAAEDTERTVLRRWPGAAGAAAPEHVVRIISAVQRYFAGEQVEFSDVALDLDAHDDFFRRTYAAARRIPWGRTTTYGNLAKELGGGPEAARAVGQAMARNPVPLIIPCHRVLAAGGKLGGFSAPGGTAAKERMLALEGMQMPPPPPEQGSLL